MESAMARVIHFEVHADDPERAARFYTLAFGWRIEHMPALDYWTIDTGADGPGINGGMLRRRGPSPIKGQPVNAFVCTLGVDDLDAAVRAGLNAGGALALPRMAIPNVGYIAYLLDTEGNIFGLHEADPGAQA
jgi:predicted enzyme related to lactoylglutathione lyase